MNVRTFANGPMKWVAFWNALVGVARIPLNIAIAAALARAVASVADADLNACLFYAGGFLLFTILRLLLDGFEKTHLARLRNRAEQAYRQALYGRFMRGTSSLHLPEPNSFTTLFRRDAKEITTYYAVTLPAFLVAGIGFVSYALYICIALDGAFFALCMLGLGLLSLLQPIILEKFLIKNFIEADKAEAVMAEHVTSGLDGYATLKLLGLHRWYMEKFRVKQRAYRRAGVRASAAGTFNTAMEDINRFLQTLGLVLILGWAMLNRATTFETAMQIYLLSPNVYSYIATVFHIRQDSATCRAAISRIDAYLPGEPSSVPLSAPETAVAVRVSALSYETNEKPLMEDVDFALTPGETCLVHGENGTGKSTLLALIMGQLAPTKGEITVGGAQVTRDIRRLRRRIAYCPQTAPMIGLTARELVACAAGVQHGVCETRLYEYADALGLREADFESPSRNSPAARRRRWRSVWHLQRARRFCCWTSPRRCSIRRRPRRLSGFCARKRARC